MLEVTSQFVRFKSTAFNFLAFLPIVNNIYKPLLTVHELPWFCTVAYFGDSYWLIPVGLYPHSRKILKGFHFSSV